MMSWIYLWEQTKAVCFTKCWLTFVCIFNNIFIQPFETKEIRFPCNKILSKKFFNENCRFYSQLYPNFWGFSSNATMTRKSMAVQLSLATTLKRTCDWNAKLEWLIGLSPSSADFIRLISNKVQFHFKLANCPFVLWSWLDRVEVRWYNWKVLNDLNLLT